MSEKINTITPNNRLFSFNFKELIEYKDLVRMYVKRDIVTFYKQTILGPLWFVIQPVLTTIMFFFVFGNLAGISTDGVPGILFYFAGLIMWNYFADCLNRNSKTFVDNQGVFGKVYFPRLVVPISVTISNLVRFVIQLALFIVIYIYYIIVGADVTINTYILLFPVLLIMIAGLSLGFGIIFSSLTTKYRDLTFLLQFGVQLWMYATPIIYPLSSMPIDKQWIFQLNPMTSIVETFKYGVLGVGTFSWVWLLYSFAFMLLLLIVGAIVFNRVEKSFMDTI